MKQKIIITCLSLIIIILLLFIALYGKKVYNFMEYNDVFDYGRELTIYQILDDDNIDFGEHKELAKYKYKKAMVKSIGNTAHLNINIKNNKIVIIGNRDLIKINNKLYIYIDK